MGLPLWEPRDFEEEQEEIIKHQENIEDEDSWSIFPSPFVHSVYNIRPSSRHSVININNTVTTNRHLSPISSSIPLAANSSSLRRSRIARRHSMLTSSLMDRRRSPRIHQIPSTTNLALTSTLSSSSPPVRSELDRRLQQRISEKEDLLEQLQVIVSLLDQFISARTALGSDMMTLPFFITQDLPAVLESAASLAAMTSSVLSSSSQQSQHNSNNNEVTTLHEMVDRLLQIPPYSIRIHSVETNIISAHRRIREQLGLLGTTTIPLPIVQPQPQPQSLSSSSSTSTLQAVQQQQQSSFLSSFGS